MKVTEVQVDPNDPHSDVEIVFDFDDSEEDQKLLEVLTAGAKATGMSIEDYLATVINNGADKTIAEFEAAQTKKKKKKPKKK